MIQGSSNFLLRTPPNKWSKFEGQKKNEMENIDLDILNALINKKIAIKAEDHWTQRKNNIENFQ